MFPSFRAQGGRRAVRRGNSLSPKVNLSLATLIVL